MTHYPLVISQSLAPHITVCKGEDTVCCCYNNNMKERESISVGLVGRIDQLHTISAVILTNLLRWWGDDLQMSKLLFPVNLRRTVAGFKRVQEI